jgi:hypothetical protein
MQKRWSPSEDGKEVARGDAIYMAVPGDQIERSSTD